MATVRCCGSRNMLRIKDRVDGASVAPATPSSARVAISISAVVENAAITEATPNAAPPSLTEPQHAQRTARDVPQQDGRPDVGGAQPARRLEQDAEPERHHDL